MAAILTDIDPITLEVQHYSYQDTNLIPTEVSFSKFDPSKNYIEYTILSPNQSFQITDQNFTDFKIINDPSPAGTDVIYSIDINPESDLTSRGFTNGEYNVVYNFLNNELSSSSDTRPYYIKEISSDRTEIRISSNVISNVDLEFLIGEFKTKLSTPEYFQDFYLNFGSNSLIIANNILLDNTKPQYEVLINLYEPLPTQFGLKDTLWVVTQVADPLAFNVQFQPEVIIPQFTNPTLKGPNLDLPLKDRINNSSNYINYEQLLTTGLASSYNQILSYLNENSIEIGVDYTDFLNFIHFSSAQSRVENFYYKVQLIEQYNRDITTLVFSVSSSVSGSVNILEDKISNIIKNFDGYEYYLYYESGSNTYPKGTDTPPYDLMASNSPQALSWYGDQITSASLYDSNNQDYLINTIPAYLKDDPQNESYLTFVNMIGQYYDNIWIYYKDVTNRYNGDNRLDFGISKDLVADALRSFGLKIYQNNFSVDSLYNAFTGFNFLPSGSSLPVSGNVYITSSYIDEGNIGFFLDDYIYTPGDPTELITNYVTASQAALYTPVDDVNKEIYKRLYHNLPLLLKQKGTIAGLRNLINVYGIPDTVLRISEFGGRDKDTTTYDYFYERYNLTAQVKSGSSVGTRFITTNWGLNTTWGSPDNTPASVQFRFNTNNTLPSSSADSKNIALWGLVDSGISSTLSAILLTYTGSGYSTSSYSYPDSGSNYSPEYQYARLDFIPNVSSFSNSASIYLPFYNGAWWSVMVNRDGNNFTLYAGSKISYNGYDGNQIGYFASSSITQANSWATTNNYSRLFATVGVNYKRFDTGSIQELRYWATSVSKNSFKDFIMNPSSIDAYNSEDQDYANYLAFRAPLGNELYIATSSVHPKVAGSWIPTSSFSTNNSNFAINAGIDFYPNTETYFLNSPIAGLRNRVNDKIQIISSSYPPINLQYTQSGNTLSQYRSIQQQYPSQGSETPDVNILEVAFSPQNEIDDDIISSLGYFNIGEYIGDPRQTSYPNYPDLNLISKTYFQKYIADYNLFDYIRLIKFFDNSLFKMIKDFVPARTNLRSGVVVKQHLLERSKYPQPQVSWEDMTYTGSIDTAFFSGSTGGTFNEFNNLSFTQSWYETTLGPTGSTQLLHIDQSEFYNGELPGTVIEASNGELNQSNVFKYPSTLEIDYLVNMYRSSTYSSAYITGNTLDAFSGGIYLWYDTGSFIDTAPVRK
jgi:hypothetical protein